MAGQIIPKGKGKFLIRWPAGVDERTGKRLDPSRMIYGTKKDAERALREVLARRDAGMVVVPHRVSLNRYLDEWLETAAPRDVRPSTLADYQDKLDRYVRPILGARRLDKLTPLDVQAMITYLSDVGAPTVADSKRRPLAPQTVKYAHAILSGAFEQAIDWQMLSVNPAGRVKLPRGRRRPVRAMSAEQAGAFRSATEGDRLHALWMLMLGTGIRPGEALALGWEHFDLEKAFVAVVRTISTRRRQRDPVVFEDTKTGTVRTIPLPRSVVVALRQHRAKQAAVRLALGVEYRVDLDLVFASDSGMPPSYRNIVSRNFKPRAESAGVGWASPYTLRHTFATLALAAGVHVKAVSERLGHASAKMTLDVYAHVVESLEGGATERIEEAIFGG